MGLYANLFNPKMPNPTRSKPDISSIYTIQLDVKREGQTYLTLDTPIPENFGFSLASSYDRPFAKPLSEIAGNKLGMSEEAKIAEDVARASTGITSIMKYLSGAVWSSGSALTLSIPFVVVAHDNALMEVTDVIKKLTQLAAPSESFAGTLLAPGPHVGNATALLAGDFSGAMQLGGDEITLRIGRFMKFTPCIINSVHTTFDTQFDQMGSPISATINVEFEAFWTTTKEDLDKFFTLF